MIGPPRLKDELAMKSSALQAIVSVLLIFCIHVYAQSQTRPAKKGPGGSISGKVTIKGKGAPGIVVGLRAADSGGQQTSHYRGATDQDGSYRITNVPPGTYQVMPAAPAFVISGEPGGKTLILTEGETVEGIDFALARGGVITGRATDSEERPLIEELINLLPAEANNQGRQAYIGTPRRIQTDDRGIYRIFGIPQGRYKVALGRSEDGSFAGGSRRSQYKQTFYPAVTDPSRATVIEVTEGSETTNVDITVGRALDTFAVSGRIVDGDTGQPLPNVRLALQRIDREGNSSMSTGSASNSQGEFNLENVMPGKYAVFVPPQANSRMRADAVSFDLIDQDVTGLLVKTSQGASVSGVIVLDGTNDKSIFARLSQMQLHAYVPNEGPGVSWVQPATVNHDGSFRLGGLQAGFANFALTSTEGGPPRGFTIMRIERDGVAQPRGIEVKDGEQVSGIRLVVNYGNGTIRGLIKVENGELPPTARFSVWFTTPEDDPRKLQRSFVPSPQVDSRGHFLVEGLAAGTYEVNANVFIPGSRNRPPSAKQQVNVADGVVNEVILTLDLEPNPGPGNP